MLSELDPESGDELLSFLFGLRLGFGSSSELSSLLESLDFLFLGLGFFFLEDLLRLESPRLYSSSSESLDFLVSSASLQDSSRFATASQDELVSGESDGSWIKTEIAQRYSTAQRKIKSS